MVLFLLRRSKKAAKDQLGLEIDKKKIVLNTPIKAIGSFEVSVKTSQRGNCKTGS